MGFSLEAARRLYGTRTLLPLLQLLGQTHDVVKLGQVSRDGVTRAGPHLCQARGSLLAIFSTSGGDVNLEECARSADTLRADRARDVPWHHWRRIRLRSTRKRTMRAQSPRSLTLACSAYHLAASDQDDLYKKSLFSAPHLADGSLGPLQTDLVLDIEQVRAVEILHNFR